MKILGYVFFSKYAHRWLYSAIDPTHAASGRVTRYSLRAGSVVTEVL